MIEYAEIFIHFFAGASKICILVCMGELKKSATVERTTISLDVEIFRKAKHKADTKGLKFSNYLASLVAKDVAGEVVVADDPTSSTVVVDLARVLVGELDAKEVAKKLGGQDQPKVLQQWLRSLLDEPEESEHLDIRAAIKAQPSPVEQLLRRKLQKKSGAA
jgi:hypothetical protein